MIELVGVTQHYGLRPVLKDISLTIETGGVTAIVGPNGMGKTTLLGVMAGMLSPQRGEVLAGARPPALERLVRVDLLGRRVARTDTGSDPGHHDACVLGTGGFAVWSVIRYVKGHAPPNAANTNSCEA